MAYAVLPSVRAAKRGPPRRLESILVGREPVLGPSKATCAIALPIDVRVSSTISLTISRQSCASDRGSSRAKSSVQRLARSTLVKISALTRQPAAVQAPP
jgi:hypothetical protein